MLTILKFLYKIIIVKSWICLNIQDKPPLFKGVIAIKILLLEYE